MFNRIKYFFVSERVLIPVSGIVYHNREVPNRYITCYATQYFEPRWKNYIPRIRIELTVNDNTWIFHSYPYAPGYCDYDGIYKPSKWFSFINLNKIRKKAREWDKKDVDLDWIEEDQSKTIGDYHRARKKEKEREMNAKQHDEVMEQAIALPKFPARKQDGTREDEARPVVEQPAQEQENQKK